MDSNAFKPKAKEKETANNLQSSTMVTSSSSFLLETNKKRKLCEEKSIREHFIDKLEESTFVEDIKVMKVFRHNALSKVDETTLQSFSKTFESG